MTIKKKLLLFDNNEFQKDWQKEWKNMPEYKSDNLEPYRSLIIHFKNKNDIQEFANLLNQKITNKTKSIWFPKLEKKILKNYRYVDE
jgi:hypothetical protein